MSLRKSLKFLIFIILGVGIFTCRAQANYGNDFNTLNSSEFLKDIELSMTVNPDSFNYSIFHSALIHLTNIERIEHEKLPLLYFTDLESSSKIHSLEMSKHHFFNHSNKYNKDLETPADRIFRYNKNYEIIGENIVSNNLIDYDGDYLEYSVQIVDGKQLFTYLNGEILKNVSYINLAKRLIKQWMESPPHKKNILSDDYTLIGCACALEQGEDFIKINCTQNFGSLFE